MNAGQQMSMDQEARRLPEAELPPEPVFEVLHVEDDPAILQFFFHMLQQEAPGRFRLDQAESLEQALCKLRVQAYDGILLDLNLKDSRGWNTFERVTEVSGAASIIIVTGECDEDFAIRAIRHGAQDYITKTLFTIPGIASRLVRYAILREKDRRQLQSMIQELRQHEKALEQALEDSHHAKLRLAEAEKLETIGRLAAGVAHEVKNPLAIIRMGMDYLARKLPKDHPGITSTFTDLSDAIKRADRIISDLLEYASPKAMTFEDISLNEVISQAEYLMRHLLQKNQVEVVLELAPDLPPVYLDRNKMVQVFVNLMMNAVQAMSGGGRLTLRTFKEPVNPEEAPSPESGWVLRAEVLDTGPGIPQELADRIFEPFFTTKATAKGTGLGLSVARMIVDMHGGGLTIQNRPEGGVCSADFSQQCNVQDIARMGPRTETKGKNGWRGVRCTGNKAGERSVADGRNESRQQGS